MFRRGPDMPFVQAAEQSRARLGFYKALPIESQPDAQMAVTQRWPRLGQRAALPGRRLDGARGQSELRQQPVLHHAPAEHRARQALHDLRPRGVGPGCGDAARRRQSAAEPRTAWSPCASPPTCRKPSARQFMCCAPMVREFRDLIDDTRRERRADFSVCDVQIPARVPRSNDRERSWWSIIPFIP